MSLDVPAGESPPLVVYGLHSTERPERSPDVRIDGRGASYLPSGGGIATDLLRDADSHTLGLRLPPESIGRGQLVIAYYVPET